MLMRRPLLLVAALASWLLFTATTASADPKLYALKHHAHIHCKVHYIRTTRISEVHGHRVRRTVCVKLPVKSPSSRAPELHFAFTNREGWEYSGSVPMPNRIVTFGVDVSSSPPGYAKPSITLSGLPVEKHEFHDTNPGRPGGPELTATFTDAVYEIPNGYEARYEGGAAAPTLEESTPCRDGGNSGYPDGQPFPYAYGLECDLAAPPINHALGPNGHEQEVRMFVGSLSDTSPWYTFEINPSSLQCRIYVSPMGRIVYGPEYSAENKGESCESVRATVSP
jgi:hypothetical protein